MLGDALRTVEKEFGAFNTRILPPGALLVMARAEGIKVVCNLPIPGDKKSLIAYWCMEGKETACVCVRPCRSYHAFWFLLAHELGHYFLHIALPRGIVPYRSKVVHRTYERFEDEADVFAAMCMLPNSLLRLWEDGVDQEETSIAKRLMEKSGDYCASQFGFSLGARSESNIRNRIWKYRQLRQMLKEQGRLSMLRALAAEPKISALIAESDGNLPEIVGSGRPALLC